MSGGIEEPYLVYPPEDPQSLQALLDAIESSSYDTLKKDCLVYFLLKWHQDGRERTFQQQRCIPPQFAALSDAYWHLDTGINVPVRLHHPCYAAMMNKDAVEGRRNPFRCSIKQRLLFQNNAHHLDISGRTGTN